MRLGALDEGVQIMQQAWETGEATLDGQALPGGRRVGRTPAAAGARRIPLWIAGGGEKKTLRIAAKYAQYTNFDGSP